jgi:hypothetical protein
MRPVPVVFLRVAFSLQLSIRSCQVEVEEQLIRDRFNFGWKEVCRVLL